MTDGNGSSRQNNPWPSKGFGSPRVVTSPRNEPMPRRVLATAGFLLDTTRRRRSGRIFLWSLIVALALTGVYMLTFPVLTDVYAHRKQSELQKEFQGLTGGPGGYTVKPKEGSALTKLVIPRLRVNIIVVEGTSGNALRAGAGHYVNSALPGSPTGNVAIAGHRTGFGEPFRYLNTLKPGNEVDLVTPFGKFVYQVVPPFSGHANPWITSPTDWSVIQSTLEPSLTLTTCDPPHTSLNRLIVRARLVKTLPVG